MRHEEVPVWFYVMRGDRKDTDAALGMLQDCGIKYLSLDGADNIALNLRFCDAHDVDLPSWCATNTSGDGFSFGLYLPRRRDLPGKLPRFVVRAGRAPRIPVESYRGGLKELREFLCPNSD